MSFFLIFLIFASCIQIKRSWGGKSQMIIDCNIPEKVKPPETNHWPFAVPPPTACPRHVTQTPAWVLRGRTQVISSSSRCVHLTALRQKGPTVLTLGVHVSSRLSLISVSYFSSRWRTHAGSSLLHPQQRSQTSAYLPVMSPPLQNITSPLLIKMQHSAVCGKCYCASCLLEFPPPILVLSSAESTSNRFVCVVM